MRQIQALFQDGHQHVDGDGDPDLGLDRVFRSAVEGFDPQMLLDPLEEQFDLPAAFVQLADTQRWQPEVVGQEDEGPFLQAVVKADPTQVVGIVSRGFQTAQADRLIADHAAGPVGGAGIESLEDEVGLVPNDEESAAAMNGVLPAKVEIASSHDVDGPGLDRELVQDPDIVDFAWGNPDEGGDVAPQIEQGVQFDGGLGLPEIGPGEERQAKVDGSGIEGVGYFFQLHAEGILGEELLSYPDQFLGEGFVDSPVPHRVGPGQGVAGHVAPDAQMIEPFSGGAQTQFDVAQAFPPGQLGKGQAQELIPTGKGAHSMISIELADTAIEKVLGQVVHQLGENGLSLIQLCSDLEDETDRINAFSNRFLKKSCPSLSNSACWTNSRQL